MLNLIQVQVLENFHQTRIAWKNDVVVIGELVEFDPLDHVTFKVAGKETKR